MTISPEQESLVWQMGLTVKVGLVASGSRSIDRTIAIGLAGTDADVAISSWKLEQSEKAAAEISASMAPHAVALLSRLGKSQIHTVRKGDREMGLARAPHPDYQCPTD